ncbi:uncharacterized protein EV420DRAFT_1485863 [Desarmillaria tabescens]|uniref:Uncharacterized protein n=1 Tax=Armillaria tabescens TaxID=1929756 RepID=A0AA39JHL4_ARMTA|nr:uncharacterized protein EV420DRAFT_1485863 [Desarmillaria tabescens]KAK0440653.1 hypothetical protein EV420DRAFT_1485863 [Desarmillaria tabescens]
MAALQTQAGFLHKFTISLNSCTSFDLSLLSFLQWTSLQMMSLTSSLSLAQLIIVLGGEIRHMKRMKVESAKSVAVDRTDFVDDLESIPLCIGEESDNSFDFSILVSLMCDGDDGEFTGILHNAMLMKVLRFTDLEDVRDCRGPKAGELSGIFNVLTMLRNVKCYTHTHPNTLNNCSSKGFTGANTDSGLSLNTIPGITKLLADTARQTRKATGVDAQQAYQLIRQGYIY